MKKFIKQLFGIGKTTGSEKKLEKLTPKELATKAGEPWVQVLGLEVDLENLNQGAFELDWNDIFIAKLIRAGYRGKVDADIVDQWFQNVCRNVVLETWEQEEAMNPDLDERNNTKNLGDGRREVR